MVLINKNIIWLFIDYYFVYFNKIVSTDISYGLNCYNCLACAGTTGATIQSCNRTLNSGSWTCSVISSLNNIK